MTNSERSRELIDKQSPQRVTLGDLLEGGNAIFFGIVALLILGIIFFG